MESNRELALQAIDNVASLDEQRKARQQREAEQNSVEQFDASIPEAQCEGGVCHIAWKPKKKAAA